MAKKLFVCTMCNLAIFLDSAANKEPRWDGDLRAPDKIKEIGNQDDLRDFRKAHKGHNVIRAELG